MVVEETSPVLISGGGLAGLSMAAFLSWHGVRCLVVEREPALAPYPRARGVNPRTMELFRTLGLEGRIRSTESSRTLAGNRGVIAVETLAGRQLGELRQYFMDNVTDLDDLSPAGWCMCYQNELEPLLLEKAVELGASVLLGTELVGAEIDGTDVLAGIRDRRSGRERRVRARYLVAADGAGSPLRERLGIGTHGPGPLGHFMNVSFEADLTAPLASRRFILCYVTALDARCALVPVNNRDQWMLHVMFEPGQEASFTEERCLELVRGAAGISDLRAVITGVVPWTSAALVADRFQHGPIFLIGDAAHVMPPTGAFGSNTGVQDAHNLAWKLAAALRGEATPALPATYDTERRPVAELTVEQAVLRQRDRPRLADSRPDDGPDPAIIPDEELIFGIRYPVPAAGEAAHGEPAPGAPGTRAPHVRLLLSGAPCSSLDLYGRSCTLVAGPAGAGWRVPAVEAAATLGVALDVHVISGSPEESGPVDPAGVWPGRHGVTPSGAVLVRPDGFVAWRGESLAADPAAEIAAALRNLLNPRLAAAVG